MKPNRNRNKVKTPCGNCGGPTHFRGEADYEREKVGWCRPCWRELQRQARFSDTAHDRMTELLRVARNATVFLALLVSQSCSLFAGTDRVWWPTIVGQQCCGCRR